MYNGKRILWRCNLRKIPIVTAFIILCSVILFGVFIINFRSYTIELNNQFESQASNRLSRASGTSRTTLDLRLSNQIRTMSTIGESMKSLNIDYTSPDFEESLTALTSNKVKLHVISSYQDLSKYTDNTKKHEIYYASLKDNKTIFSTTGDMVYFITPYLSTNEEIALLVKSMYVTEFSDYVELTKSEYRGTSYLIDSTGRILASDKAFQVNDNLLAKIKSSTFLHTHSYNQYTTNLFAKKAGISNFILDGESVYSYYSPTILSDLYLL